MKIYFFWKNGNLKDQSQLELIDCSFEQQQSITAWSWVAHMLLSWVVISSILEQSSKMCNITNHWSKTEASVFPSYHSLHNWFYPITDIMAAAYGNELDNDKLRVLGAISGRTIKKIVWDSEITGLNPTRDEMSGRIRVFFPVYNLRISIRALSSYSVPNRWIKWMLNFPHITKVLRGI